ncbi:MAG: hypothetical protein AAF492_24120, partial [Verrucomicrobiota bacterium]
MIERIKDCVRDYTARPDALQADVDRMMYLDASNGLVDGCCCLFFDPKRDQPVLVGKAAASEAGRAVFEHEYETLTSMHEAGMNRDRITTPIPLLHRPGDDVLITLQSAVPGELMKNIPGRKLFAPSRAEETLQHVTDWWRLFHEKLGVDR